MNWASLLMILVLIVSARTVPLSGADCAVGADVSGSNKRPYSHQNKRDTGDTGR